MSIGLVLIYIIKDLEKIKLALNDKTSEVMTIESKAEVTFYIMHFRGNG